MAENGGLPWVLVTNDDGIEAPGIRALAQVLGREAQDLCRVAVCAPHVERSAVGHAITLRDTLEAQLVEDYAGATLAYSLTGTPADCSSLGTSGDLWPKPALVLSGINKGGNAGLPVIYSGTVAGAREAHMAGIPAIALSLDWRRRSEASSDELFEAAAQSCMPLIKAALLAALDSHFPRSFFLNVNVPVAPQQSKGFRLTSQSRTNIGFSWARVERRTGLQVAEGRAAQVALPQGTAASIAPPAPVALPGMGRGGRGGVPLPGMGRSPMGGVALPGMAGGRSPISLAQLGSAVAAKGAERQQDGISAVEEKSSGPTHRIHYRHVVTSWQCKEEDIELAAVVGPMDVASLAAGYITVTPLALLTAAPSAHAAQDGAQWLLPLLA